MMRDLRDQLDQSNRFLENVQELYLSTETLVRASRETFDPTHRDHVPQTAHSVLGRNHA